MTFLNPAILFGLLAASIPIILHFLNLRKLKKVEFSTLIFLKELQKTRIRKIKLKQWLLLLLRVLIILLLVIAFARPAVKTGISGSSSSKTTAIFIIDNTFCMSIVTNDGSYLNKAKKIASELLSNFQSGDEIAIIPLVTENNYSAKAKSDFNIVEKEIESIQISSVRKTLNDALINSGKVLYDSKNFNKEVYLLTDLQSGSFYNREAELSDLSALFQSTRFFVVDLQKKSAVNLGIDSIKLNTQIFEKNKPLNFQALVKNYSNTNSSSPVVSLFINNKRSAQQSITLNSGESKQIFFETTLNDTGLVIASVEIEDDDISYDNKRFTSFYVPDKIKLLLLYNSYDDIKFIRMVLNSQTINSLQVTEANISQLPALMLQQYDAVVLIGPPGGANEFDQLKTYCNGGGGVLFFPGSNSDLNLIRNFFRVLELPLPENFVGKKNIADSPAQFDKIDFNHPLFSNLFEDKSKTKIESPDIYYYMKINSGIGGRNIISMFDKSAFLSEYKSGTGKFLIFNTLPVLSWTNFPLKSFFPALVSKSILYLSSHFKEDLNSICGEELFINLPASRQIKVVYPDDITEFINTDSLQNKNYIRFNNTKQTGTYKFYMGNRLIDFYSVNHDPNESIVDYNSIADLETFIEKIGLDVSIKKLEETGNISEQIYNSRFGTELWKYFIIAALFFALIEMFVAKSSRKDIEQINN